MSEVPLADRDLAALVPEWLEWSEGAHLLGVTTSKVRTMIREHELAQAVSAPGAGPRVPADFIQDGMVVKGLPGLLTLLHDHRFDDRECIAWLFTDARPHRDRPPPQRAHAAPGHRPRERTALRRRGEPARRGARRARPDRR